MTPRERQQRDARDRELAWAERHVERCPEDSGCPQCWADAPAIEDVRNELVGSTWRAA